MTLIRSNSPRATHATGTREKRLILLAIDKGGAGKSFFCVRLLEWLASRGQAAVAFDPDFSNSTLTRFYPDSHFLDIRHSENLDHLIDVFNTEDLAVVDGVGAQQQIFLNWIEETDLLEIGKEIALAVTLVLIIEEDKDTVYQAGEAVRRIGDRADWLVVRNLKLGQRTRIYDTSEARQELIRCNAREIVMDKLPESLMHELQAKSLTIPRALSENTLFLLDRQRLIQYQRDLAKEFESVKDIILP